MSINPAPTVSTQSYKDTAATVRGQGAGLQAMGAAFAGFFNTADRSLEQVQETMHREELVQIQRENEALKWQATADQATGKAQDPRFSDRQAYAGTYVAAQADADAFKMGEDAKAHMAKMPLDGSVDPQTYLKDWYTKEVGKGTGDAQYDSRKLYSFTKQAETLVAEANETVRRTAESNALNATLEATKAEMNSSPDGLTTGKAADLYQRLGTMARGNVATADKWFESVVRDSVTNYGQAVGTLRALWSDGDENSWAARNPAAYTRLSRDLFEQTHKIKTFEAGQAVQQWNQDFQAYIARPDATPEGIASFEEKAYQIDSRHGVGPGVFHGLDAAFKKSLHTKASVSVFEQAVMGDLNGIHDGGTVAALLGKKVGDIVNDNYEMGLRNVVMRRPNYLPGLAASISKYGIPNVMDSEEATQEFMDFISSPTVQAASPDGTSKTYKAQLGTALNGRDPAKVTQAFRGYRTLEQRIGPETLSKYFQDDDTYGRYLAMKAYIGGDVDEKTAARYLVEGKDIEPLKAASKGQFHWAQFVPGSKAGEADAAVDAAILKSMRAHTGTDGLFFGIDSSLSGADSRRVRTMMFRQLTFMQQMTGAADFQKAADVVAQQIAKEYTFLPGQGKHYQMVPNPYGSKGRELGNPLNVINGKPVYALGWAKNVDGTPENTAKTFREDMAQFKKTVPGLMTPHGEEIDGKDIALGLPDNNGLHPMLLPSGAPIRVIAGQKLAMPVTENVLPDPSMSDAYSPAFGNSSHLTATTLKTQTLPTDEAGAFKFLQDKAPPGVFYVKAGVDSDSGRAYFEPRYGARIKYDYDARKAAVEKREADMAAAIKVNNARLIPNPLLTNGGPSLDWLDKLTK